MILKFIQKVKGLRNQKNLEKEQNEDSFLIFKFILQ